MGTILLILLVLFLIGALPAWPYSRRWGLLPEQRYRPDFNYPLRLAVGGDDLKLGIAVALSAIVARLGSS